MRARNDEINQQPDPLRRELLRSVFEPSSLGSVAEAVSIATADERRIYVERTGSGWRWSLTHPGGAYPLLRATARFLRVDYRRITVGFRSVAEHVFVLCPGRHDPPPTDAWAVINFDRPTGS